MQSNRIRNQNLSVAIAIGMVVVVTAGSLLVFPPTRAMVFGLFSSGSAHIVEVDNSRIYSVNIDTFDPEVTITSVAEQRFQYVVTYSIKTIKEIDGVWQDVVEQKVITIPRSEVPADANLGEYLTEVLKQSVASVRFRLRELQLEARANGLSQKTVETTPPSLIGIIGEPTVEVFPPAYVPEEDEEDESSETPQSDTTAPSVTVLGDNPAFVAQESIYSDLGVVVFDLVDPSPTLVVTGSVNTGVLGDYVITYTARDASGNETSRSRTVRVVTEEQAEILEEENDDDEGDDSDDEGNDDSEEEEDEDDETPGGGGDDSQPGSGDNAGPGGSGGDTTAPILFYIGASSVLVLEGGTYNDLGAIAQDNIDGFISDRIVTINPVNTMLPGTYSVMYSVTDSAGNSANLVRTVTVVGEEPGNEPYTPPDESSDSMRFVFP